MNFNNKKVTIIIILILIFISSVAVLIPTIIMNNNSIKSNTPNKHIKKNAIATNDEYMQNWKNLITKLSYIKEFTKNAVIKQEILKHSILGGTYNKKKYKISELAWFNRHSTIPINRFSNQTNATITNSNNQLKTESRILSYIIPIIKEHPFTYSFYLYMQGYTIPEMNFFIKNKHPNNNNHQKNIALNNTFDINKNNTNINNIYSEIEETTIGAKTLSFAGSSLVKAIFININFNAKILTFNNVSNRYKFASKTSIFNKYSYINNETSQNKLHKTINSFVLNDNLYNSKYLYYFNSDSKILTKIFSNNNIFSNFKENQIFSYPAYFNTYKKTLGLSTIQFKKIIAFKNNKILYILMIVCSPFLILHLKIPKIIWKIRSIIKKKLLIIENKKKVAEETEGSEEVVNDGLKEEETDGKGLEETDGKGLEETDGEGLEETDNPNLLEYYDSCWVFVNTSKEALMAADEENLRIIRSNKERTRNQNIKLEEEKKTMDAEKSENSNSDSNYSVSTESSPSIEPSPASISKELMKHSVEDGMFEPDLEIPASISKELMKHSAEEGTLETIGKLFLKFSINS